jgi:hypothetical protein
MQSRIWPTSTAIALADFPELQVGYTCPVCGLILASPPQDFLICVSCGTEFGNDDLDWSHAQLREVWMNDGFRWWSDTAPAPDNWDPIAQVVRVMPLTGLKGTEDIDQFAMWPIDDFWVTVRQTADSEVACRD